MIPRVLCDRGVQDSSSVANVGGMGNVEIVVSTKQDSRQIQGYMNPEFASHTPGTTTRGNFQENNSTLLLPENPAKRAKVAIQDKEVLMTNNEIRLGRSGEFHPLAKNKLKTKKTKPMLPAELTATEDSDDEVMTTARKKRRHYKPQDAFSEPGLTETEDEEEDKQVIRRRIRKRPIPREDKAIPKDMEVSSMASALTPAPSRGSELDLHLSGPSFLVGSDLNCDTSATKVPITTQRTDTHISIRSDNELNNVNLSDYKADNNKEKEILLQAGVGPSGTIEDGIDRGEKKTIILHTTHDDGSLLVDFQYEDRISCDDSNEDFIPQVDGPNDDVTLEDLTQAGPSHHPPSQPLPTNRMIRPKNVSDNHFYKVKRVFFIENEMMVELVIQFFYAPADPKRHLKKYTLIIPFVEIEGLRIYNAIKERIVGKAIFIKDEVRYTKRLMADVQFHTENEPNSGNTITEVFRFERPSVFVVDDVVYYCCGIDNIWRLTEPSKKLDEEDLKKLKFVVFYTGVNKEFVDSEETLVRGICELIECFNKQQPNTLDHAWIWVYIARVLQGKLYLALVPRYPQSTTIVTSGKKTRCAKSLAGSALNWIANGEDKKGGKFKEAQVFKMISSGQEYICDEMTKLPPAMKNELVAVVQHQFQRLFRAVGKGGYPNAVLFVHCNIEPEDFNFDECDRSKMCIVDVGRTQTGQVKGVEESPKDLQNRIIAIAKSLHKYYPNFLAIGVECLFNGINDDEMKEIRHIVQDDDRKGQDVIGAIKVHRKFKELAEKHSIELPNSLKSEPDVRCITQAFTRTKCAEDLLNWVDDQGLLEECELVDDGVRIPASNVMLNKDTPKDLHDVISACDYPSSNGRRWRYVPFSELSASMIDRINMATLSICKLWCEEAKLRIKEEKKFTLEIISAVSGENNHDDVEEEDDSGRPTASGSSAKKSDGVETFPCDVCGKICKNQGGLKIHKKIHERK